MKKKISSNNIIYLSNNFPDSIISLKHWSLVTVYGKDCSIFLNNQFTINISKLNQDFYQVGAHCTIQGKVLTTFLIFKYNDGYAYIIRSSTVDKHISALKKYAIFSDVSIKVQKNFFLFGLAGLNSFSILKNYFTSLQDNEKTIFIYNKKTIILKFKKPIDRFLIVFPDQTTANTWINSINSTIIQNISNQWLSLDIESCFPVIDNKLSGKFLPQFLNLNFWNAIHLNKGCYYGQEIIYRAERLLVNKFFLCSFIGFSKKTPELGIEIFKKSDDKEFFNKVGTIISYVRIEKNKFLLQGCINKKKFNSKNIVFIFSQKISMFFLFNNI